jgi:hypothetical protein
VRAARRRESPWNEWESSDEEAEPGDPPSEPRRGTRRTPGRIPGAFVDVSDDESDEPQELEPAVKRPRAPFHMPEPSALERRKRELFTHSNREGTDVCVVCLEKDFGFGDLTFRVLRCGHFYHQCCAAQWFATSRTCPVCRAPAKFA